MILVDVHAHLDHERFKNDLDEVIERAKQAGVKAIITSGVNSATNRLILKIAEKYDIVKASFGLYPIDALAKELELTSGFVRDIKEIDVDSELEWIKENKDKCIAIGECGLDYHWITGKEKEQQMIFQKVIDTVEKINKPIIVHSRKAELDAVEMLESSKLKKIVMHCFSAKKSLIKRAADNGWSFSVPPIITRLQHFQTLVEIVNINQLLTETDAPYLSPFPGERNESAFVAETIKKIAEIKRMTEEDVAGNIYMNYTNVFL
ncbi:TatD family hydrolase [Candidatus Woesearchaeota archaeon]|nr:TatD family hydrolase [Candidatus Woesearchaeota archaeon]